VQTPAGVPPEDALVVSLRQD